MIRVLIVDDSLVAQNHLAYILESDPEITVTGKVGDGSLALHFLQSHAVDVITMDIHMSGMDGFETTRKIMEESPRPIIIISSIWDPLEVEKTFQAMEAGAISLLKKPKAVGSPGATADAVQLIAAVKFAAGATVRRLRRRSKRVLVPIQPSWRRGPGKQVQIIALGASTGGPPAILQFLSALPPLFPLPILIVQHISRGFTQGFVDWLNGALSLPVKLASDKEFIKRGMVYVAPEDVQMGVTQGGTLSLTLDPPEHALRPAASYLFRSVARVYKNRAVGILLTGMGVDGAFELKQIQEAGGMTLVQDQETAVIFGMPGEAIRLGAADHILPPVKMASLLLKILAGKTG